MVEHHYPWVKELRLSPSTEDLADGCMRKFEFYKLFPKKPGLREDTLATSTGHCLHHAFQHWISYGDRDLATFELMMRYPYLLEGSQSDPRSLEACYATFEQLTRTFDPNDLEIASIDLGPKQPGDSPKRQRGIVPCVEVPFKINIRGFELVPGQDIAISYVGYLDLIMFDRLYHKYVVVDVKTTRRWIPDVYAHYQFHRQCIPYSVVLGHITGTDIEAFDVKYLHTYIDIEKPSVTMVTIEKGPDDVQDWYWALMQKLQNISNNMQQGRFPRDSKNCINFNSVCEYSGICPKRDIPAVLEWFSEEGAVMQQDDFVPWIEVDLVVG